MRLLFTKHWQQGNFEWDMFKICYRTEFSLNFFKLIKWVLVAYNLTDLPSRHHCILVNVTVT